MSQTKNKLDSQTETRVVAMIARGDTYETIAQTLEGEGSPLAISTISAIKKRNAEALAYMKRVMLEEQTTQSGKLLAKSRTLIERKLDRALRVDEELKELINELHDGVIDPKEYSMRSAGILGHELTITELNSVTKEAFNQSQIEQGKPTAISNNPQQAREDLGHLLDAIKTGDEVRLQQIVFNPNDAIPNTVPKTSPAPV